MIMFTRLSWIVSCIPLSRCYRECRPEICSALAVGHFSCSHKIVRQAEWIRCRTRNAKRNLCASEIAHRGDFQSSLPLVRISIDRAVQVDLKLLGAGLCILCEAGRANDNPALRAHILEQTRALLYIFDVNRRFIILAVNYDPNLVLANFVLNEHIDLALCA